MSLDIVVVGSANIDHSVRAKTLPRPGETVTGSSYYVAFGGKGANQAVAAARMGAQTAMIGCVGDDTEAESIIENLRANGVDISAIERDSESQTGSAHIVVAEKGENQIVVVPGANEKVLPGVVMQHEQVLISARLIVMQLEIPLETVMAVARLAKEHGIPVMLDPAPARELPGEIFPMLKYIVPNEHEASIITDVKVTDEESASEALRTLRKFGVEFPVIKLGEKGLAALEDDSVIRMPAFPVKVVDTTAAGDAFAGGFGSSIVEGQSFWESLRVGSATAALACTKRGAIPSLPRRDQVLLLLKSSSAS